MEIIKTPRFLDNLRSHGLPTRDRIRLMIRAILANPKDTDSDCDPHELKQFSTKDFEVWSWDVSTVDRLVFEIYKDGSKLIFTNCKDHTYRGKRYSSC